MMILEKILTGGIRKIRSDSSVITPGNMSTPFRHAIILECLSGRLKFGKGSICSLSYLMELSDSKGQEIKNIILFVT